MFFLTLLPLAGYFFWLALLQNRRRPTVLNGVQDFMFLSGGLLGLFSLGPGRLVIPIWVITFWGCSIWLFWTAFYFSMVYLFTQQLTQRIVIYHCPLNVFIPKLVELAQKLDQRTRLEGNVLFLPDFGIQCTITGHHWGLYLILKATGYEQDNLKWKLLKQNITTVCSSLQNPINKKAILFGFFSLILLLFIVTGFIVCDISVLINVFFDYWY
ncbi:MAG: hypothetical protein LBC20_15320 [Planctomycetaceae bacterium]|jgi:hypothetical protein|nr:hypothetical protein [Planctomycetaceae bacterium]